VKTIRPSRRRLRSLVTAAEPRSRRFAVITVAARPRAATVVFSVPVGVAAGLAGGPVAGVVGGVYAGLAVIVLLRRHRDRIATEALSRALDAIAVLAADLRTGGVPDAALGVALPALEGAPRVLDRVGVAWQVAEVAGAPLADLLDRLETDLRGLERVRQMAAAQAAGAQATAWLLAALPVAGIGVGFGMGADPLRVLLGTPVGAACAGVALLLQVAGLTWSARLAGNQARVA
jgi:tight adherence protein B